MRFRWMVIRKNSTNFTFLYCDFLQWLHISWYKKIIIKKYPEGHVRIKWDLVINISVFIKETCKKSVSAINQRMYQKVSKSVYLWINNTVLPEWQSNLLPYNNTFLQAAQYTRVLFLYSKLYCSRAAGFHRAIGLCQNSEMHLPYSPLPCVYLVKLQTVCCQSLWLKPFSF